MTSVAGVLVLGLLMSAHMPYRSELALGQAVERRTGRWQAIYVLGADCPCSTLVGRHLAASGRLGGIDEQVVFVGSARQTESMLKAGGLRVVRLTARRTLQLYGARSAPLLVFVDPAGKIRYSGGFARRNDFRDGFKEMQLWAELRQNHAVTPLPAFGCALVDERAGACSIFSF